MKKLSFVIACYNSENSLQSVVLEICENVDKISDVELEIIMVDDFSADGTRSVISSICESDDRMKGVFLSANFGQSGAILAGFSKAEGDLIAYCDDDGQCPVDLTGEFFSRIESGADIVTVKYRKRKAGFVSRIGSKVNHLMVMFLIGDSSKSSIGNFFITKRFVIDELLKCKSPTPYLSGMLLSVTSHVDEVEADQRGRMSGKTNYSLKKLVHLWLNGMTGYSIVPLRFASLCGFIVSMLGFIYAIVLIIQKLIYPSIPIGYSSIVAIMLFMFGFVLSLMGLMGEYVGRIYLNSNSIPQFVIREVISGEDEE